MGVSRGVGGRVCRGIRGVGGGVGVSRSVSICSILNVSRDKESLVVKDLIG